MCEVIHTCAVFLIRSFSSCALACAAAANDAGQRLVRPRVAHGEVASSSLGRSEPETSVVPSPPAREIPRSQFGPIRAWVRYGMTDAQVAQIYGVPASEIERVLGKA